ncbi:MAG: thiamine-phosphate kinase, partial [SAR202 cluster bacterium]|nr:thiamine-phosphate kinase [SAR202 cluster bacterium]
NGVTHGPLLLRSAARPGDQVAVTGTLGGAEGGLQMLLQGLRGDPANVKSLRDAHLRRTPRIAEGRILAAGSVRCAMDISDGLVDDLGKLCHMSKLAARISADRVPTHPALSAVFPGQETSFALMSGEEYELLFTAPPDVMAKVCPLLPSGGTVIGEIREGTPGQVDVVDSLGRPWRLSSGGWDHFRS